MGAGYIWNGTKGASSSTRYILDSEGKITWGGSISALDDRTNIFCEAFVGVGLLPVVTESLALAGEIPAVFVRHELKPRDIQLSLNFKAASLAVAHAQRAGLLAKLPYGREIWLRYNGANATLQIRASVNGHFDIEQNARLGRKAGVALQASDPRFSLIYGDTTSLAFTSSPSSSYVQVRTDASGWGTMSSGLFAQPRRLIQGPDGTFYIGTLASGGTAKVQKWTGTAWSDVISCTGSITAGPIIYDLVFNADATKLYVLGDYTTVNGTGGYNGVCQVTLSGPTPATMGTGASGGVPLCGSYTTSLSRLYVGGLFATNMGGVANTSYYCYWDGSAWQSVGTQRPTAGVYCLLNDGNDNLILGGDFTNTFPLNAASSPTATVLGGGDLTQSVELTAWVIPADGTNFTFTTPSTLTGGPTVGGVGVMGPTQRVHFTTTAANKQALLSWTAIPGAKYYLIWIGQTTYEDGTLISAGPVGGANSGVNIIDALGRGNLSAVGNLSWSNVNGSVSYDTSFTNSRYTSGAVKYTGTSLLANSGVYTTMASGLLASGTYTIGAWVKGAVPDKLGWNNGSIWTYPTTTAQITDGSWVYYTATTAASSLPKAVGVFFSGTITAYIGYIGIDKLGANHTPYIKISYLRSYIVPASITSVYTSQLINYSLPDAPTWNYDIGSYTRSITDDFYLNGGTGSFGSRIIKHRTADGSWERMAQSGGGFNGVVRSLCWVGGALVAGGDFTLADNTSAKRVAYSRGKSWLPLGVSGMGSGSVYRLAYYNGTLWAVGSFTSADGDTTAALVARMDGFPTGGWTHSDLALTNSSNNAYDVLPLPYRIVIADDTNYASASGATTVAYSGTGNLYPKFTVTGPGVLRSIENSLTKARILMNYTLQAGEVVTIDCAKATVTSTYQGDITDYVQVSSNLDGFYIASSVTQTIFVHMTGTTGASSVVMQGNRSYITGDV